MVVLLRSIKKKAHQRNRSDTFRLEDFALWCSEVLDSTECAISLAQQNAYLDRFAEDKIAHAQDERSRPSSDSGDTTGGRGGEFSIKDQLYGSGSGNGRYLRRTIRKKCNRSSSSPIEGFTRQGHHYYHQQQQRHHGAAAGGGGAQVTRLSSMFTVYAHLSNLRDLKNSIEADRVQQLFSPLHSRPGQQAAQSTPRPSHRYRSLSDLAAKHSDTQQEQAVLASETQPLLCCVCLTDRTLRIPLCGHSICSACCRGLSKIELFVEGHVCQYREEQMAKQALLQPKNASDGEEEEKEEEEEEEEEGRGERDERRNGLMTTTMSAPTRRIAVSSPAVADLPSVLIQHPKMSLSESDISMAKNRQAPSPSESNRKFVCELESTVKLFCCPICHKWDIVRIHRYIAAVLK